MKERKYAFRREDNGKVVWVDWATMIEQQASYITLPDGVEARRCLHLERHEKQQVERPEGMPEAISDSLGFPDYCLDSFRADLEASRLPGIEFRPDPQVPEYYRVHASSRANLDAYTKHRGLVNRTGSLGGGVRLSQADLDAAREMVSRGAT